jgi:hypothetical protein
VSRVAGRALLCALVALAALLPSAAVAVAPSPSAAHPGGAYSVVRDGPRSAMILAEWASSRAAHARLTLKASGLTPDKRYRVVGSSAPCGEPSTSSKRVFSKWFRVGSRGAAWAGVGAEAGVITLTGSDWRDIRSMRLMEEEGIFYFCRSVTRFGDPTADHQGDAAIAILDAGNRHGIVIFEQLTDTTVRIRHDIQVGSDQEPRLTVRSLGCSQPATTQSILIALLLPLRGHGQTFGNRTETVDKDETIVSARSVRVRDAGSPPWDCAAPRIIAVLIG